MDNEYIINASRLRSISNNDINNNSWTYKLNDGLKISAGSTIQVSNCFINKQGITSDSIEFNQDIIESFEIGFTVPQTSMFMVKPERTAKDDRLLTASLEDPEGSLGLQTSQISTPLTNYFDIMVQHNIVKGDGLSLFDVATEILSLGVNGTTGIDIFVYGNRSADFQVGMPMYVQGLVQQDSLGNPQPDGRLNKICGYYMVISAVTYNGVDGTSILTETGYSRFIDQPDFTAFNYDQISPNALTFPTMNTPDLYTGNYGSLFGVAMINSLSSTLPGGETLYKQTKLESTPFAWENPDPVPMLEGQIDNINYQAGIDSQVVAEEFRSQTADNSRETVWNANQKAVTSYEFDKGSYSFLLGPSLNTFEINQVVFNPLISGFDWSFNNQRPGLMGHSIRMNCNNMMIGRTGDSPRQSWYSDRDGTQKNFFPFIDAPNHTEYPERKDLSIPRPAQPAKYKDKFSPQVDYLRNGFSYDGFCSRVELFTAYQTEMISYDGENSPVQPNIYQARENQTITPNTLKTLPQASFLDRVVLSQTMIGGLMNRFDSHPYVKRTYSFPVMDLHINVYEYCRVGKVLIGSCDLTSQSQEIKDRLLPQRVFRNELDPSTITTRQEYLSTNLEVRFMIKAMANEGATNASITDVHALTNLRIAGLTFQNFRVVVNKKIEPYTGTSGASAISFQNAPAYEEILIDPSQMTISIDSEDFENQNPQYIPIFTAKGAFSELRGNTDSCNMSTENDIDLGATSCKFNYFMDSNHNQSYLNYEKMVGEDYLLNPNITDNANDFTGLRLYRVASHSAFNMLGTNAGEREADSANKRIFIQQRANAPSCGIHPMRGFTTPDGDGLTSFTSNLPNVQSANYLFGSTSHCSMGSMRPPVDKDFSEGAPVMKVPVVTNVPTPSDNGLTSLADDLESFDPDATDNVIKMKMTEERVAHTTILGIRPLRPVTGGIPAVVQEQPLGIKDDNCKPNCASALGDYEGYPYSIPSADMMDTGGSGDDLCLVKLMALVSEIDQNYGDYVLVPLTSTINIEIPKGVYSISGFLDLFNNQIKDLNKDDEEEMARIDNYKTVTKFTPLGGNALTGGQVTLLNDFLPSTHQRTNPDDPSGLYETDPIVIAVTVQTYNDIVRGWQLAGGDPIKFSYYMAPNDTFENCYYTEARNITIGGGSYVWKNFRDKQYWCEFVDKYSDNIQDLIGETETDDIQNYDLQFYFAQHRNLDDGVGAPNVYGCQTVLGIGDGGVEPVGNPSTESQYSVSGDTVPQIDKVNKYNSVNKGIYVGSPDFQLTYDSDNRLFALDGLHYAFRNPTVDLTGESAYSPSSIGQPTVLYRSLSDLIQGDYEINGVSAKLPDYIQSALEKPIDQISGVFIYNMSSIVSQAEGDFINNASSNIGRTYNDYFSSNENAKIAWSKTLWARLGFDYETFNTRTNNDLASYYLNPVDVVAGNQVSNYLTDQTSYLISQTLDSVQSVKYRPRQVLIQDPTNGDSFNDVGRNFEDNYLPGVKTSANFDIRTIPTIASLPGVNETNSELVRLFNNSSISTIKSMSGGYVYHPMKLCSPNSFDMITNYTAQNISTPQEGYIFQGPLQGNTVITGKSGVVVPPNSQLLYLRPYQFLDTQVPGYNPTSWYSKTYAQAVSGTNFPVAYDMLNVAFQENSGFQFSHLSQFNISNGVFRDRTFNLNGSMFLASQSTSITSESNAIEALKLPILTTEGHYLITSDLISKNDSINGSDQLSVMSIVPISSLSSQDFITSFGDISHTVDQDIILNSIKVEILNPDLSSPFLEPNSTIIFKVMSPNAPPQPIEPMDKKVEKQQLADEDFVKK